MPAFANINELGRAMQRISESETWNEYAKLNTGVKISFRHIEERLVFMVISPVHKGYSRIFENVNDLLQFAFDELQAEQCRLQMADCLFGYTVGTGGNCRF